MFVFYLSICCSSTKDKTGQSAKAFLHQFLCSHIFLFCLFYLPSTTILPSSQCPATRQHRFIFASVSIHLYVRTYTRLQYCISTYTYIYVRTYTRLTYCISTRLFLLAPMCRDTSWRSGSETIDSFPVSFSDRFGSFFGSHCEEWDGKTDWVAPPCFKFELSRLQNIFAPAPPPLQNVTEKVQLN